MPLSQQERQIVEFGSSNNKSRDEIISALESFRTQSTQPQQDQGFLKEADVDIQETGAAVGRQLRTTGERIVETAQDKDLGIGEKALGIGAQTFRGVSRVFGEGIIGAAKLLVPQSVEDKISGFVEEAGKKIAEAPITQDLLRKYNALPPEDKRNVDNALGFAEGFADLVTLGAANRLTKPVLKATVATIEKATKPIKRVTRTVSNATSEKIRSISKTLSPANQAEKVDNLTKAYTKSFVENNASTRKSLSKHAARQSRRDQKFTRESLLRELAEEDFNPIVEGKLATFDNVLEDISERTTRLAVGIDPFLSKVKIETPLNLLKTDTARILRNTPRVGAQLNRSLRELDRFIESWKTKFGDTLSANDLNEIRLEVNSLTKSFKDEVFKQDVANAVGNSTRRRIDDIADSDVVRSANKQIGKLSRMRGTIEIIDNKTINVGIIGSQVGRYLGVLGLATIGGATGGVGGLVIAGIAAHYGGEVIAQLLRSARFSTKLKKTFIRVLRQDEELVARLIAETEGKDKEFLEQLLLPAPRRLPERRLPSEPTRVVPAPKDVGRDPKTGKFKKVFLSGEKPPSLSKGEIPKSISKELEPLAREARKFETAREFVKAEAIKKKLISDGTKVNADNTVTLFHAASPENLAKIQSEGLLKGGGTATGGTTGLQLEPSVFLGTNKKWVRDTWGRGRKIIEVKIPVQDIRQPAQNTLEVYVEGGLKRGKDGIWRPTQKPRSTFFDRIAERNVDKSQLTDFFNQVKEAIPVGKRGVPLELEPLAREARKFDTAREFRNSLTERFIKEQQLEPRGDSLERWFKAIQLQQTRGIGFERATTLPRLSDIPRNQLSKEMRFTQDGKAILFRGVREGVDSRGKLTSGDFMTPNRNLATGFGETKRFEVDPTDIRVIGDGAEVIFHSEKALPTKITPLSITDFFNQVK